MKRCALLAIVLVWNTTLGTAFARQPATAAICDTSADFFLGIEDYPKAIRLHLQVLRRNPNSALAHYHLGFAQGMMGNRAEEIREYQRAEALGLKNWDLSLRAVLLGENRSESHFNLALVYERRGILKEAEHETLASLRLTPWQPDTRNLLGVIYAREGKIVRALLVWHDLVREAPDYEPARKNLAILSNIGSLGETAVVVPPQRPPPK